MIFSGSFWHPCGVRELHRYFRYFWIGAVPAGTPRRFRTATRPGERMEAPIGIRSVVVWR